MLKVKNIPFVGGDTMEFSFDFGTKVAGSTAECPLNWCYGTSASAMTPSTAKATGNVVDKWNTDTAQVSFDQLKVLDGSCTPYGTITANYYAQFMVELDLTPLCNSLFGGNTNAMATACKNIITNVWAKGSGSNNGAQTSGVIVQRWYNPVNDWDGYGLSENDTNAIVDIGTTDNRTDSTKVGFLVNNKLYILIRAKYPSNGTISSEVDVDYINIKIQFARVPDVMTLLPITFPNTWSMLIKGFSPAWDSNSVNGIKFLLGIDQSEYANYDVSYQGGKFVFDNWDGSTAENLWSDPISLTKFQTVNLLIEQTSSGRRMRILKNQGSVLKYAITSSRNFPGDKQMGVLMHVSGQYQADAFFNSMIFLSNKTFDDTEAEGILKGTAEGFEENELLPEDLQNGTQISTGQYSGHGNTISVLPNNQYEFKYNSDINLVAIEFFQINNKGQYVKQNWYGGNGTATFITSPTTTSIWIKYYDPGAHAGQTMSWSNCSLKLKM